MGDGSSIRVWGDAWLSAEDGDFKISTPMSPMFENMFVRDLFITGTNNWDVDLIDTIFNARDKMAILKTTPSPQGHLDRLLWNYSRDGNYTVKSAYKFAYGMVVDGRDTSNNSWGKNWKMEVPPKIKVFYWRLCKGWLAVKEKLRLWGLGNSSLCPICENGTE